MKIAFIGAGKVGTAFGIYLKKIFDLTGYYSKNPNSAIQASQLTKSATFLGIEKLVVANDLIALTTPDDQIELVTEQLAELTRINWSEKSIFHMSGVHSSELLAPLYRKGATIFSLHPLITINSPAANQRLPKASLTIEGKGEHLPAIKDMLQSLENPLIEIAAEDKELYHAAACIVSNYLVTLLDDGIFILKKIGFTEEQALQLIEPLTQQTLNNIFNHGTEQALTGPIVRGDIGSVRKHLGKLKDIDQLMLATYQSLGRQTTLLAARSGKIDLATTKSLEGILKND